MAWPPAIILLAQLPIAGEKVSALEAACRQELGCDFFALEYSGHGDRCAQPMARGAYALPCPTPAPLLISRLPTPRLHASCFVPSTVQSPFLTAKSVIG